MHDFLIREICKINKEVKQKIKYINKYLNFELLDTNLFVSLVTSASIRISSFI